MANRLTILPFNRADLAVSRLFQPSCRINGNEMEAAIGHLISLKTSMFSGVKALNGKMDKMVRGVGRESLTRVNTSLLSGRAGA